MKPKISPAVCYFGSYDSDYSRNRIIKKGLERGGVKVLENKATGLVFTRYLKLVLNFLKFRKQFKVIIVGFPGHYDVHLAFLLGKLFGKKVYYDIFASTYETYVLDRKVVTKKSLRAGFYYFLDWLGIKLADYVIIDTRAHGKFYRKVYGLDPKKTILVYVGSDSDYFYPRNLKETTDVLFYGSYQPLQGTGVIVKAAALLPNIKFKMIGDGQERKSTETLAKSLNLKNVKFVNWLPLEQLATEINKAKICLGIFGSSKKAHVVIPNKVYDYIACGKPVITGETQAIKELLVSHINAILVSLCDHLSLEREISSLMKNKAEKQSLAKEEYQLFRKRLKPDKVVRNLITITE